MRKFSSEIDGKKKTLSCSFRAMDVRDGSLYAEGFVNLMNKALILF